MNIGSRRMQAATRQKYGGDGGPRRMALGPRLLQFYEPHEVELWLTRPHPLLGGRTAIQVIAAGEDARLHEAIDELEARLASDQVAT